jgi:hypothetical protein
MTTINDIKAVIKEPSERLEGMARTVDDMQAMEVLANSEGGKVLIKEQELNQERCINMLIQSLDTQVSFDYVKGLIAEIKASRSLLNSIDKRKYLESTMKDLTEAFKEEAGVK